MEGEKKTVPGYISKLKLQNGLLFRPLKTLRQQKDTRLRGDTQSGVSSDLQILPSPIPYFWISTTVLMMLLY